MSHFKKETGLTLIEMMIAMVLGIFVSVIIITVFSTNVRSSTENIKMIRLNQELRGVMTMMVDELKRSGYSADSTNADFMNDFDISSGCARYSYDEDSSDIRETDERFGFNLIGNTIVWAKDYTSTDCSASSTTPTSITDPNLALITTLDFNIDGSSNKLGSTVNTGIVALTTNTGVSLYEVTITLTGTTDLPHSSSANDPRRTIVETVRVRNDDPKD